MSQLSWLNPYTGTVENNIIVAQADPIGMKALHMITADPNRTPTFTPICRSQLVLLRHWRCGLRRAGRLRLNPGAHQSKLRLEPRRHSA